MKLTSGIEYNYNKITEDRRNALVDFFKQETNTFRCFHSSKIGKLEKT